MSSRNGRIFAPIYALALCFAACGSGEGTGRSDTAPPTAEAPSQPAPVEPIAASPEETAAPAPAAARDPEKGKALYLQYCASCHGPRGAGDGPAGQMLDPKPAHHNDGRYMNALSNEHLFKVIKSGGPAVGKSPLMAPWGGALSDPQIWDVVAFLRTLPDDPAYTGPKP